MDLKEGIKKFGIDSSDEKKKLSILSLGAIILLLICISVFMGMGIKDRAASYTVQGSLKADEVNMNSKIAGNIEEVRVREGDRVKAGDVLIVIDSSNLQAKKIQAEGALSAANATYQKALNGARSQEISQAKAAADLYTKTYNKVKSLYEQGAVSENEYNQVYAQYIAAQETYSMAREGARSEDISAAAALVEQASGALAEVNSYIEDCQIKAPMDGVVTSVNVKPGELVSTGTSLVAVIDDSNYWVEVNVDESKLDKVQKGSEVTYVFAAYPDEKFKGEIYSVNEKPAFATQKATKDTNNFDLLSYTVKIRADQAKDKKLYSGMTVDVMFGE